MCTRCGQAVKPGAAFCGACGAPAVVDAGDTVEARVGPPRHQRAVAIAAVGFVALILIGGGGFGVATLSAPREEPAVGDPIEEADDVAHEPDGTAEQEPVEQDASVLPTSRLPTSVVVDPSQFLVSGSPWPGPEFLSPSGNLACAIPGDDSPEGFRAVCTAEERLWNYSQCDPSVSICDRLTIIDASGETGADAADGAVTAREAGHPVNVLAYGYSVQYDSVTCASTFDGVVCEDSVTGHGFIISRSEHVWW